jgi:hypothetical protein
MPFLVAFVAWTLVIWTSRLNNIWRDEDLDTAGQLGRSALAASFVAGAVVVALAAWRAAPEMVVKVVGIAGAATAGVWLARSVAILVGDWSLGFKVVHTVLAVVSVALAAAAFRESRGRSSRSMLGDPSPARATRETSIQA